MNEQTEEKKAVFRLCAKPTTAEATAEIEGKRFSRITPDYTLIYTDEDLSEDWLVLTEEDAGSLSQEDRRWLNDCNVALIAEEVARQKPKIVHRLADLLDEIERRLKQNEEGANAENGDRNDSEKPDGGHIRHLPADI